MFKLKVFAIATCIMIVASASWAMDVYDWRAKAEGVCAQSFKIFDRPIQGAMAGGRPEKLVVEKIETMQDSISTIQALGEVDEATARIVIKSLVHSYFTDKRLLNPLNFDVESYQQVYKNCSGSILRYDPDGKKAAAYKKTNDEKTEQIAAKAEAERRQQEADAKARAEAEWLADAPNREKREAEQRKLEEQKRAYEQKKQEEEMRVATERYKQQQEEKERMTKSYRTDEDIAREEAERKKNEEEQRKENSGVKGFFKSLF